MKEKRKKRRFWGALLTILFATMTFSIPVMATEGVPSEMDAQKAYDEATVDVRIKAEVPSDFTGTVSVEFAGKDTDGFVAVMTMEEDYTTIISLPRDLYTYKQHSVVDGYDVRVTKNFILDDACLNNTYLLPVIVAKASESTTGANEDMNYVTSKFYASPQEGCDFTGSVELTYSGTNGNSFIVTLNKNNFYTVEIPILMDLYTLSNIETSEGFEAVPLYSFNTLDSKMNQKYQMAVKVYNSGESPEKEEEINFVMKQVTFQMQLPDSCAFNGDVKVSYTGNKTYPFEVTLKNDEGYVKTVEIPEDTYILNYAVSYDSTVYTFATETSFALGEATKFLTIPVTIMQDGSPVEENFNESIEPITESVEETEYAEENTSTGSKKNSESFLFIMVLVVIGVCAAIYYFFNKDKRENVKGKKEKKDNEEISLEDDSDLSLEDDDIDIDM